MTAPGSRLRALAHEGMALLAIVAIAAWWCAPWVGPGRVFGQRDTWFVLLGMEHLQDVLLSGQPWAGSPLGWPLDDAVALTDWVAGQALIALPLRLAGAAPELEHIAVVIVGLCLTAWTCHKAAAALLGPGPHTWVAAAIGGFHPHHLSHAQHLNLVHHEAMVGGALLLGAGLAKRRPALAAAGAAVSALAMHFGAYMGLHALFAAAIVCAAAIAARAGDARCWLAVAGGGALATLPALPVVAVYERFERTHELQTPLKELVAWSWDPATSLMPISRIPLHRALFGADEVAEASTEVLNDPANPGYTAAALALLGLALLWRTPGPRWAWAAVVTITGGALLLALGPVVVYDGVSTGVPGPYRLLELLPGAAGLRDPVRWLGVAFTASGLLAAAGVRALGSRSRATAWVAALGALTLLAAERAVPGVAQGQSLKVNPDYALLDSLPPGAVMDTGLSGSGERPCGCSSSQALRAAAFHGRALAGGRYARFVPALGTFDVVARRWPSEASAELLAAAGVRVVFEHDPTEPVPVGMASCTDTPHHRVCVLPTRTQVLPKPSAVATAPGGPVLGVRLDPERAEDAASVRWRCDGRYGSFSLPVWSALAAFRGGSLDAFLDRPCDGRFAASQGAELYEVGDSEGSADGSATGWPSLWPRSGRRVSDALRSPTGRRPPTPDGGPDRGTGSAGPPGDARH